LIREFEIGDLVVGCRMWNKDRLGIILESEQRGSEKNKAKTPIYNVMWLVEDVFSHHSEESLSAHAPFSGSVSKDQYYGTNANSWEDQTSIRDIYKMYVKKR